MSPVRGDPSKIESVSEMLRTFQPEPATEKGASQLLDFKEYLEKELNVPKAAAVKQKTKTGDAASLLRRVRGRRLRSPKKDQHF